MVSENRQQLFRAWFELLCAVFVRSGRYRVASTVWVARVRLFVELGSDASNH